MTPERWRQVDRILEEALELPPDERAQFLDRLCASDHALRRDVEALLQAHGNAGTFLNDPALALAAKRLSVDEGRGLVGRTLGHYRILSLIGAGGMGEVYRASDPRLGREVAVKVLPEHLAQNPEALSRFEREAKAVAALSHPNILAIHDVGEEQGIRYAVMEFLEGENLRSLLNTSQLAWREAVAIGASITEGLAAAHAKEIIHRDLKPENVFRTTDGRIKILDFGLARKRPSLALTTQGTTGTALTEPWMVLGTVGYMSPEQIRGEEADAPSDIFSLGCVLYEMVTGKRAYARPTTAETMAAIVQGEMPDTGELREKASPELEQVILRCLQKDPALRYPSARDLCHDLNTLMSQSQTGRPATNLPSIASKWPRRVAASAVLVAVFMFGYFWWRNTSGRALNVEKQRLVFTAPGTYGAASFSPDCGMITYTKAVDGVPHVFVKNLNSGDPIQITFAEAAVDRPRWSPHNDQIVFSAGPISPAGAAPMLQDQNIWSLPPLGGTPRKLIEGGVNANWSRDGNRLVFERGDEIWVADADGTNQHKVEGVPQAGRLLSNHMPSLSPDGSLISYFQTKGGGVVGDFWVIPATGGLPRQLTSDVVVGKSSVWTSDGRYVVFASERAGSLTLWKVPATGGSPGPVLSGAGDDSDAEICGDRLVYRHTRQSWALTLLDPVTGKTRELRSATNQIVAPSFSPKDDRIVFFSHENDNEIHVFTIRPDGGNLTRVTSGKGEQNTQPHWSADGAYVYYYQQRPVVSFRRIQATGGQSLEIEHGWNWGVQNSAQVDPTVERIVYALTKENGEITAVVRDRTSGNEEKLDVGLSSPRWSNDGKSVLGSLRPRGRRDGDIFICPAKPGACEKLTNGYNARWSKDNSSIYFLRINKFSDGGDLFRFHLKTRVETLVAELRPLNPTGHTYDVSPRGEIVYVQYHSGPQELWLADLKP